MFGHQDNNMVNAAHPADPMPDGTLGSGPGFPTPPPPPPMNMPSPAAIMPPPPPSVPAMPSAPAIDNSAANGYIMTEAPNDQGDSIPPVQGDQGSDDLLSIKQQALQQLSPLVDQLDQSPEEKFKTTMMMIQASDDQSLIPSAYDAARQIQDEKARAQALLDVVNEINYFTQHPTA